jgi:hypothetical protein
MTLQTKLVFFIMIGLCLSTEFLFKEDNKCKGAFQICQTDDECCPRLTCMSGLCDNGCLGDDKCHNIGEECSLTKDCCFGLLCLDGMCDHRCLDFGFKLDGESCFSDVECCNGYVCRNGACLERSKDQECKKQGEDCKKSTDCCISDKLLCLDDKCDHRC